jgi:hypothetical protein
VIVVKSVDGGTAVMITHLLVPIAKRSQESARHVKATPCGLGGARFQSLL